MLKKAMGAVGFALLLSGCETMMFHVTLNDEAAKAIAEGNANVNQCLARGLIDRRQAYAFSAISAQTLDITVVDRALYKSTYEMHMNELSARSDLSYECNQLQAQLPRVTQVLTAQYLDISRRISAGRAAESRQAIESMNQLSRNVSSFGASSSSVMGSANRTAYWPKVTYSTESSSTNAYLVNTSKGQVQCRVTNKNFVFCL